MRVIDILQLINSRHIIKLQEEVKYQDCDELHDIVHTIHTTMYGNPTRDVDKDLLSREVYCIFPLNNELIIYLKSKRIRKE